MRRKVTEKDAKKEAQRRANPTAYLIRRETKEKERIARGVRTAMAKRITKQRFTGDVLKKFEE